MDMNEKAIKDFDNLIKRGGGKRGRGDEDEASRNFIVEWLQPPVMLESDPPQIKQSHNLGMVNMEAWISTLLGQASVGEQRLRSF